MRQPSVRRSSSGSTLWPCIDAGTVTPVAASSDGARSTWLTSSQIVIERLNRGPLCLSMFNEPKDPWQVVGGDYKVMAGGSSKPLPLSGAVKLAGN